MTVQALALVNAALFIVQIYVNYSNKSQFLPVSRKHETLITPARYGFAIWAVIYILTACLVATDIFYPSHSVFESAAEPNVLRALFTVSCLANMAWIGLFANEAMHHALVVITMLWASLFTLYLYIQTSGDHHDSFNYGRYFLSELGLTVYFAWVSVATLVNAAMSMQIYYGTYLPLVTYTGLLSVLGVATISAVVFNYDWAFGVVAVWALVAISRKTGSWENPVVERVHASVRVCAAQNAVLIAGIMVVSIAVSLA